MSVAETSANTAINTISIGVIRQRKAFFASLKAYLKFNDSSPLNLSVKPPPFGGFSAFGVCPSTPNSYLIKYRNIYSLAIGF